MLIMFFFSWILNYQSMAMVCLFVAKYKEHDRPNNRVFKSRTCISHDNQVVLQALTCYIMFNTRRKLIK